MIRDVGVVRVNTKRFWQEVVVAYLDNKSNTKPEHVNHTNL